MGAPGTPLTLPRTLLSWVFGKIGNLFSKTRFFGGKVRNKRIEDVLFHARDTSIFLGNKKNSQLHEMGKMFFEGSEITRKH